MSPEAATFLIGTVVLVVIIISAYFTYRSIKCGGCAGCSTVKDGSVCAQCKKKR
ncbi:hypothetical protein Mpt1_c01210 [Candidatus Methanoplasma termitum]|uniref:Virus attachment protein p12 family protein n=1 Tax=Candidatus Methanoplasma termitum TaxID=1577791 RepID=A0A0A7LA56_9ARCH|nr:FeoB-associated Cys-rich membrane protein [Candidatus Methanoplasma termitum]AIZ56025.1 hypothetical protein Mpt1_c01210 [Candidatus Methanoplasma termitum]